MEYPPFFCKPNLVWANEGGFAMRFSRFLFCFLLFTAPFLAMAGTTGKITGKIIDKETNEALPGVNVLVIGTSLGAATDVNGEYFILGVPAGTYTLRAQMIGYVPMEIKDVRVQVDLTSRYNYNLEPTVVDITQAITVTAQRPLIQKDMTASRVTTSSAEITRAPLEDVQAVVALVAGTVGGNFRGGRASETTYVLEGASVSDPMGHGFNSDVPLLSLEEMSVETSGFSAEYGNVQSGMVSMVMKEGGTNYSGMVRYKTNDLGSSAINRQLGHSWETLSNLKDNKSRIEKFYYPENLQNIEASFGGPIPFVKKMGVPGRANFFLAGEINRSRHSQIYQTWYPYDNKRSLSGKITYSPSPTYKLSFTGLRTWRDFNWYDHTWKNTTYERSAGTGNAAVDLNHDGDTTDAFSMLDNLPKESRITEQFTLNWTHTLNARTYYEIKLSRYLYDRFYNVNENINEDTDGDNHLDIVVDGIDTDGDGDLRSEDLNGNGIWDWKVKGPNTDLFADKNHNGYIDASENKPRDQWISWQVLPLRNYQDTNGFYVYGQNENVSYYRLRWNDRKQYVYGAKFNMVSQIHPRHQFKMGATFDYMDIFSQYIDLASGGNVYQENFSVFPFQWAGYVEDKMEYEGMIVNVGLRFDQFNSNFDNYPADVENPVPDSLKGTGGSILNPTNVPAKSSWSPRIGMAFPITERDLLHFNYGRYFQEPPLTLAFTNITFDLSGAFPLIGNPNIEPERTTSYEFGLKHQFGDNWVLDAVGFYKDITGLTDTRQVFYTFANWFGLYINQDYGSVRGFEVNIYKRPTRSDFLSGSLNYSYGVAKGKSSSTRQSYDLAWSGDIIPTTDNYLDWDVRHNLKLNLDFRIPSETHWLGIGLLDDMGINLINYLRSGFPYSPPKRSKEPLINTERMPGAWTVNMTIDKRFKVGANYYLTFFVWVDNLLNRRNIGDSALRDEEWYYTYKKAQEAYDNGTMNRAKYMDLMDTQDPYDKNHNGNYDEPDGQVDLNKKYPEMGSKLDPRVYDPGRNIRFGASFQF
jgi:outer membrane receptor protein involved in Fe transport